MRNKIIVTSVVVITAITLFTITSQPKTAVGTAAMTVMNTENQFTMPTLRPFPTLSIETRIMKPIVSETPRSTSTPSTSPTKQPATPKPTKSSSPTNTTKPAATAQPSTNTSYTDQVIELVNKERAKSNLGPLAKSNELTNSAQSYSQYMADKKFFSHDGPDGSTFISRNKAAGYYPYRHLGENIAAGQRSPQEVMNAWMNSSGHRANIMKAEYKEIGVGYTSKSGTTYNTYWAQEFGSK